MKKQVILDLCDGQKQISVLEQVVQLECYEFLGATVSWGQTPFSKALEKICAVAQGRIPVYAGCPGPLARNLYQKDAAFPKPEQLPACVQREHAIAWMIRTCRETAEPITVAVLGPMTNIGMALRIAPDIAQKIQEIILIDTLPEDGFASENLQRDPDAAQIAIRHGVSLTLAQLPESADLSKALLWALEEDNAGKAERTHIQICIDRGLAAGALLKNAKKQHNARVITEEMISN